MYKKTFISHKPQYKINERITAPTLRVLDSENKQVGILPRAEALQMAREQEIDLVEIAPTAQPPVAKLIDYKKFLYQIEKKKREEKRKAKVSETKEVRLGPFMGAADLENMRLRAQGFLEEGDKVRLVLKYRGRQIIHPEFGQATMRKLIDGLSHISKLDREPKLEGKQLVSILSPERKTQNAKEESQGFSREKI